MTPRWRWLLALLTRRLWFRASIISLLSVAAALVSIVVAPYLPAGISAKIGADSVESILTIIASSMLAVTTFSLSTMVSAYSAATSNVTPRATRLLIQDTTAQNVLGTFVGSFLYSLVALITLSTGSYGERGRVVLFVVTVGVVLLIVVTLLRWIDYLLGFGRVGETTAKVEEAAERALKDRHRNHYLGGAPLTLGEPVPPDATPVFADRVGYVQHLDIAALAEAGEARKTKVWVGATPGTFVDPGRPLVWVGVPLSKDNEAAFREGYTVGEERTFDQDPRFGLSVLAEIASRALSPGINDPGTAIDVIGRTVRILSVWTAKPERDAEPEEPRFPDVFVPSLEPAEMFDDVFHPIARDGAGQAEVQIRLQKAFAALARCGDGRFRDDALRHSREALERAERALDQPSDIARVRGAAETVGSHEPMAGPRRSS
ncbi:DUF2254 domain-containing protein [Mesorhizobium australicum]|uniref:Uncharacterized membrane protein n=1 Tax=Mesorhizobium australicum TaxID=536018 RepID=A0A1X7PKK7_9HYPH|nr:DUF2254 domain-containing protein [Mesorhizobium australicum]SMH51293.1 Uncharacterized membrane protein [Mesorhizobium australicum]